MEIDLPGGYRTAEAVVKFPANNGNRWEAILKWAMIAMADFL
jgi:hypothetical protein